MSDLNRFDILVVPASDYTAAYAECVSRPDGSYVHYDDHAAEIARLTAENTALRADLADREGMNLKLTAELVRVKADLARVTGERDEHRSTLLTMESQIAMLEHEMYETPPGTYSPDGWTYKQAFTAEKARRIEAETARDAALAEVGRLKGALVTTAIRASEVETLVRKAIPWIRPVHQVPPKCECERCQWVQSALAALTPPAPQQKPAHASVLPECCGDTVAGCTNCQPAQQQEKPRED